MNEFTQPEPTKGASELFHSIPEHLGSVREDCLFDLYKAGQFPLWLREWKEVGVSYNPKGGPDLRGAFYVLPDFLCVGTDEDFMYTPLGALTAEKILGLFDAVLPTPKMVDAVYEASEFKQEAQPWGPPYGPSMTHVSRWPRQTKKIRSKMEKSGASLGDLVEGHLKNVTVSEKMVASRGTKLSFYGWYHADGTRIQGDSLVHGVEYCDYSHGVRGVLNWVTVGDECMSLEDALSDPSHAHLFSYSGRFHPMSYRAVREAYEVTTITY